MWAKSCSQTATSYQLGIGSALSPMWKQDELSGGEEQEMLVQVGRCSVGDAF